MQDAYVTKGTRVRFRFLKPTDPQGSLAGVQAKVTATLFEGEGVVRNIWADDAHGLVNLRFNVERADGTMLEVPKAGVVCVIEDVREVVHVSSKYRPKYDEHQPAKLERVPCGIPDGGARRCGAPGCGDKIKDAMAYRGTDADGRETWYHDFCISDGKVEDSVDR